MTITSRYVTRSGFTLTSMRRFREVEAARRFYIEARRKVTALRTVLPLAHARHFAWFTQMVGSDGQTLDVFEHQFFAGRYIELGLDGTVYVSRDGDLAPADETTGERRLRDWLPTREQWLRIGGHRPGGFLSDEPLLT